MRDCMAFRRVPVFSVLDEEAGPLRGVLDIGSYGNVVAVKWVGVAWFSLRQGGWQRVKISKPHVKKTRGKPVLLSNQE